MQEKTAEEWFTDSLQKYLPPKVFESDRAFKRLPSTKKRALVEIKKIMQDNIIERAGYSPTSIRGIHYGYIFYKPQHKEEEN